MLYDHAACRYVNIPSAYYMVVWPPTSCRYFSSLRMISRHTGFSASAELFATNTRDNINPNRAVSDGSTVSSCPPKLSLFFDNQMQNYCYCWLFILTSVGWFVFGANCLWGETPMGQKVDKSKRLQSVQNSVASVVLRYNSLHSVFNVDTVCLVNVCVMIIIIIDWLTDWQTRSWAVNLKPMPELGSVCYIAMQYTSV